MLDMVDVSVAVVVVVLDDETEDKDDEANGTRPKRATATTQESRMFVKRPTKLNETNRTVVTYFSFQLYFSSFVENTTNTTTIR